MQLTVKEGGRQGGEGCWTQRGSISIFTGQSSGLERKIHAIVTLS